MLRSNLDLPIIRSLIFYRDDLRENNDRLHRTHILKLQVFLSFSPPNMGVRSHMESRCISDSDFYAEAITQLSEYPHA